MTDNFRKSTTRRSIILEVRHVETPQETLDRLRLEVAALRASRARLVLAADADRRRIERDLHEGVQQHLVALAVNLQLAGRLADAEPAAAKALLEEMGRDVQRALDETAQLAQRIYPPLLDVGGLTVALRAAAADAGVVAVVGVPAGARYPRELAETIYLCWLDVLARAGAGAQAMIDVREEEGVLAFEIACDGAASPDGALDDLRDRVEALGGRLAVGGPGGASLVGSLPR